MTENKLFDDDGKYRPGSLLETIRADGRKPSKAAISFDRYAPELTPQEWDEVRDHMFWMEISRPDLDPAERRELLSDRDTCPCCHQWLGHNHPPADADEEARDPPYRRQTSFDFKK